MDTTESTEKQASTRERKSKSKERIKENREKREKKEKTKKRDAKPRRGLGALLENSGEDTTQSGRSVQEDIERGLTQDQILQLRTLEADADDGDLNRIYYASDHDLLASQSPLHTKHFVENEISGEFFRVTSRPSQSKLLLKSKSSLRRLQRRRRRHGSDTDAVDEDDDHHGKGSFRGFTSRLLMDIEVAVMLLGHGIVVGLSWMDSFNLGTSQDRFIKDAGARVQFVCTYSGLADRSRQLFFLLFNLVLLGLMRKISRLRLQQDPDDLQVKSLRLVQASMVFTTTSLLVLLIGSPSAVRLTKVFENDPNWCDQVVPSGSVESSSALTRHQQCTITNAVLLSIGYLCVCIESTLGISSNASLRRRLAAAHKSMDQLDQRNEHLEGKGLDELSIGALKDLIQLHQRAVESTESALVTKLQLRNPTANNTHWTSQ